MRYQFEHDEITQCKDCPCFSYESECLIGMFKAGYSDKPQDCPLVAISKTETTSCEWCEGNVSKYFDVNWYDFNGHERLDKSNYCPNCGRKLD